MPRKKIYMVSAALCLLLTSCSGETFSSLFTSRPSGLKTSAYRTVPDSPPPKGVSEERGGIPSDSLNSLKDDLSSDTSDRITALLEELITPAMSEYEKVKTIHDYLVIHVDYDYDDLAAGTLPDSVFTAEGALFLHSAVCEGYAKAFSLLCSQSDIENMLIYGTADDGTGAETHAWNQVRIDGEWYNVDVTWDDPLMNGEQVTDGSNLIYDYFLVPDRTLLGNHTVRSTETVQTCTSERYLEESRRLTIAPYLSDPCTFAATDDEIATAVDQYLTDGIHSFQIICDVTSGTPKERTKLILNHAKKTMESRMEFGQISAETQYGVADYALVNVTIVP